MIVFFVWRFIHQRKKRRKLRLASYHKRLKIIVAELFTQSNELDTVSKYVGLDKDVKWAKSYQDSLTKLLLASENLNNCNTLLSSNELESAQESLLLVSRAALQVHRQFKHIQPEENFDSLQVMVEQEVRVETTHSRSEELHPSAYVDGEAVQSANQSHDNEMPASEVDSGHVIKFKKKESKRHGDQVWHGDLRKMLKASQFSSRCKINSANFVVCNT